MTDHDYASAMYADGFFDGAHHTPMKYSDEPEYAIGYASGEQSE